jgi:hypothetical protein
MRSSVLGLLVLLAGAACGGDSTPPPQPVTVGGEREREGEVQTEVQVEVARETPGIARALGPTSTFADLIAAIRRLDDRGEGASEERCVLRGGVRVGDGIRLEAELAVPVRPVPDATPALVPRLRSRGPVSALAVWGQRGSGALVLAVLTGTTPIRGREAALFVSEDGARARFVDSEISIALAGPHTPEALSAWLGDEDGDAGIGRVLVTADAGVSLAALRRYLAAIPPRLEVALAVPLADDVRLPPAPAPPSDTLGLCASEPEWEPSQGEVDVPSLRTAIGERRDDLAACLTQAAPERAHGGRIGLRFRVEESGAVEDACAIADGIGDPRVRACVLDVFRRLRVAPPTGGRALVEVPIVLVPNAGDRTRALCD